PARVIIPKEPQIERAYREVLEDHMHVIPAAEQLKACDGCGELKHPLVLRRERVTENLLCPECFPVTEKGECSHPLCGKVVALSILERNGGFCDDCVQPIVRAPPPIEPELAA